MGFPQDSVLPQGSLVLVTGATGFLGSVVVDQLLHHGFRVRGTVRDPKNDKASWMPEHFEKRYGTGRFDMVQVDNMHEEGCFDQVIKGCSGVIHVASVVAFVEDPNTVVTPSIAFVKNALAAAGKEDSVKRFVLTSSSSAVDQNKPNEAHDVTDKLWADWAVKAAWEPPPYTMQRALANYSASKVQAEQELWSYVDNQKPRFVANSVLPSFVMGLGVLHEKQGYMTSMGLFKEMFENSGNTWRMLGPQWCVDVVDTALLHIACLVCPDVKSQRIFAYAHHKTWTDWIRRLKKLYPEHQFPEPNPDEGEVLTNIVGRDKSEELLKWMGRPGWRPLDEGLKEMSDPLV